VRSARPNHELLWKLSRGHALGLQVRNTSERDRVALGRTATASASGLDRHAEGGIRGRPASASAAPISPGEIFSPLRLMTS
jgi:hypothetical protein